MAVSDFKRGDADEALNSIANFNFVPKACDLEDVAYFEKDGSAEEDTNLGTLVRRVSPAELVVSRSAPSQIPCDV